MAQEVYDQKKEEEHILAELILDASVRLGELTRVLPKSKGGEHYHKTTADTAVASAPTKPKLEAIQELGFSAKQVERFETLAKNKELVEQVKMESREKGVIPTRTQVLELAKAEKQKEPKTKVCRECGGEKSISEFYTGKPDCKACHNLKKTPEYRDVKGNLIKSTPEVDALFAEKGAEIHASIINPYREAKYTIDDLGEELQSIVNYFDRNISNCISSNNQLLKTNDDKQKIMAVLSEAETTIGKIRKEYLI